VKYQLKKTKRYRKDIKRLEKANIDLTPLNEVINLLREGEPLLEKYHDHKLSGDMKYFRECHIGPDWLLMYRKDEQNLFLVLLRTGDHRQVLGIE